MINEDGTPSGAAFIPRRTDKALSVNWVEYFNCANRELAIGELREVYSQFRKKKRDLIAIMNVGDVCEIEAENRALTVLHDPIDGGDESHSGIFGYTADDIDVAELVRLTVQETFAATDRQ